MGKIARRNSRRVMIAIVSAPLLLFLQGCKEPPFNIPMPDTMTWVGNILAGYEQNTANNPIPLEVKLTSSTEWEDLLSVISFRNRFVDLDISKSTWGREFHPGTFREGKGLIVRLHLPAITESIKDGTSFDPTFNHFSNLRKITIPDTVTDIGAYAFAGRGALERFEFPPEVTVIREGTFRNTGLRSMEIPGHITKIEKLAFANCFNLEEISNPDNSITFIGDGAFFGCVNLTEFIIPPGITEIRAETFRATGLVNITIPENIVSIGDSAFRESLGLTSVDIPASVISIGDEAFANTAITSITLPDGIEAIGMRTFANTRLESIVIPDTVNTIGQGAFEGSRYLTQVNIPYGVTAIGQSAFRNTSLVSVYLPDSVTEIGASAFSNTLPLIPSQLRSIRIPDSVTSIGANAFEGSRWLTEIVLPESLTSISDRMFFNSGITSITIPDGVTTIGNFAFAESAITKAILPESVITIANRAFSNCTELVTINIPNGVSRIGEHAFYRTRIEYIMLPQSITAIEAWAFSNSWLRHVDIPYGVTTIGNNAFRSCHNLESVVIPSSVTTIGDFAFAFCTSLASVTFEGELNQLNVSALNPFPGNLREVYFGEDGGPGTYITTNPGINSIWVKND